MLTFSRRRRPGGAVLTLGLRVFALALLQGTAEAVGLRSGLDDIRAVSDAVDQRLTEPGVGNHLGPFRERQIGGDDHGGLLGPFGDYLEQELRNELRQRYVDDFI